MGASESLSSDEEAALYSSWAFTGVCAAAACYVSWRAVADHRARRSDVVFQAWYRQILTFPAFYAVNAFLLIICWRVEALVEVLNMIREVSEVVLVWAFAGSLTQICGGPERVRHLFSTQPVTVCGRERVCGERMYPFHRVSLWHFVLFRPVYGVLALVFHLQHMKAGLSIVQYIVLAATMAVFPPFFALILLGEQPDADGKPVVDPSFRLRRKFLGFKLMLVLVVGQRTLLQMLADAGALSQRLIFTPDDRALRTYCLLLSLEMVPIAVLLRRSFPPDDAAALRSDWRTLPRGTRDSVNVGETESLKSGACDGGYAAEGGAKRRESSPGKTGGTGYTAVAGTAALAT